MIEHSKYRTKTVIVVVVQSKEETSMSGCSAANSKKGIYRLLSVGIITCPHFESDTGKRVVEMFFQNV